MPTDGELADYYEVGDWARHVEATIDQLAEKARRKAAAREPEYRQVSELLGPPGAALDFGCGPGGFLDLLQDNGWETFGMEPVPADRSFAARRHRILDAIPTGQTFRLVVVYHVLEHLRDPGETTRRFSSALVDGGHVYLAVPDASTLPEHRKLKYVANGRHIFTYTESGLRSLLALAGLETVQVWHERHWMRVLARKTQRQLDLAPDPLSELEAVLAEVSRRSGPAGARLPSFQ